MTETCSGISGYWINEHPDKLESAGRPFKGVHIAIINNHISINSKMNMRGYHLEEKLDSSFITSDLGNIKDGFVYIKGRAENTTISGGEKINCDYVKDILLSHQSIESVLIKVVKNREWGESIEADVVLNTTKITEGDIKSWCQKKIAEYAVPKRIHIKKL